MHARRPHRGDTTAVGWTVVVGRQLGIHDNVEHVDEELRSFTVLVGLQRVLSVLVLWFSYSRNNYIQYSLFCN